ncbi:hypothetical protein VdG2_00219 [Verticillium dahliae VDG2]|nr:hypothetical protein VdG2_00219 [Verticillium dahliae VDG2]
MSQKVERPSDTEVEAFLDEAAEAPPVDKIFYYIGDSLFGDRFSATPFHLEDGEQWHSSDLVFDAGTSKGGSCAHFARHLSLFVGPKTLRAEGIGFTIHCAGPGDMILVRPREYHAVVNWYPCVAMSTNFVPPEEPALPDDLAVCKD